MLIRYNLSLYEKMTCTCCLSPESKLATINEICIIYKKYLTMSNFNLEMSCYLFPFLVLSLCNHRNEAYKLLTAKNSLQH